MSRCKTPLKVSPQQASLAVSAEQFHFASTAELEPFVGVLGQERAKAALEFGLSMDGSGYNLFVMGESGCGRSSYVKSLLTEYARHRPGPLEWIYVNNFDNPHCPRAISFAPGTCRLFCDALDQLIHRIVTTLTAALENPVYLQRKAGVDRQFNHRYDTAVEGVEHLALAQHVALYRDAGTFGFTPMADGKSLDEAEFALLPEEQRKSFQAVMKSLEQQLNEALSGLPQWRREAVDKHREHNHQVASDELTPLFEAVKHGIKDNQPACDYLDQMRRHLLKQLLDHGFDEQTLEMQMERIDKSLMQDVYLPSIVVEQAATEGGPVVFESHPSYKNLFGRVDYVSDQGVLTTNYRQICAGALHRANGGYLIVDAEKLLQEPFVWEGLKRTLQTGVITIETPYSELGLMNTSTLTPDPIPLQVKLVLIGSRDVHYLLQSNDPDFREMFRVLVDFDGYIPLNNESVQAFARLLQTQVVRGGLAPLSPDAVRLLLGYACRLVEHQQRFSARFRKVFDLLDEADLYRRSSGNGLIEAVHVEQAISASQQRSGRIGQRTQEEILDHTILINTQGKRVGELNGLTVWDIGESRFGAPARISASAYPGSKGVLDIEREVELGQAIHSKGVMILTGYLGNKYALRFPLSLSANIALEQSYGYVDGDSASLAEICCLLSAVAQVPLDQGYAVTGSINQHGEVQAVGGINEKIEGFFQICQARGLSGGQGVIIPLSNVNNLLINSDVLQAMKAGQFVIYAVANVDEALELLTGKKARARSAAGQFTKGSFNALVEQRLHHFHQLTVAH